MMMTDLPPVEETRTALEWLEFDGNHPDIDAVLAAVARAYVEGRLVEAPTVDIEAAIDAWDDSDTHGDRVLRGYLVRRVLFAAGVIEDTVPGIGGE